MPSLLASLGSYYTPTDGYRHAIVSTTDGEVHEIFYSPKTGKGNATLAAFCNLRFLTAFYTGDDQTQHPVVATADGNIFEVYYKPGSFHISGLIANFANIIGIAGFYAGDDHNRILIVATADGAIHEVFWNAGIGSHVTQPALATFPGLTHVAAYYSDNDQNRHAIVATADGNIQEVWYSPKVGIHITPHSLGNLPNIVSIAAFYAADDQNSIVIVAQADGTITEIFFSAAIGLHQTRPALTVLPGTIAISAFYSPDDKTRHVIAVDASGNVTEVFYTPADGVAVSRPPLATFAPLRPIVEYIGADIRTIDAGALQGQAGSSPAGRCVALAGSPARLHVFSATGGIFSSSNGSPWTLEPGSPAPSWGADATMSVIATSPLDANRVVACNPAGLWQSTDGGASWSKLFDPTTLGLTASVTSIGFDAIGRLYAGVSAGVAVQQGVGQPFTLSNLNTPILSVAVCQTKVWARSQSALFMLATAEAQWAGPFPPPATLILAEKEHVQLAATDGFAFIMTTAPGNNPPNPHGCAANNVLGIFNAATSGWSAQEVNSSDMLSWQKAQNYPAPQSFTCQGTGGDSSVDGRQFVKCITLEDTTLPNVIGQRIQLFFGAGQEVWRAVSQNLDGTISDWQWTVGCVGPGYTGRDQVHADIYDFHIDTAVGGRTAWLACDGGVYKTSVTSANYDFAGAAWVTFMEGLSTHQIFSITVLNVDPVSRPRIAYAIPDNGAYIQDTSSLAMEPAPWQSNDLGDGSFTGGDPSVPAIAWIVRALGTEFLFKFGNPPQIPFSQLVNLGPLIDPAVPTRFRFIPSPREKGSFTSADVVMMVALPLVDTNGTAFPTQPGPSSGGKPVLIRNRTFDQNCYINAANAQGKGWTLERSALPANCIGFAVSGDRTTPVYFAFDSETVFIESDEGWTEVISDIATLDSRVFGSVFPNPYDSSVVYVVTWGSGVQVSRNGGQTFVADQQLNALLPVGAQDVNQISFNYDNPAGVVVSTESGHVLFSPSPGTWKDLTPFVPRPLIPLRSVAIDCFGIYLGMMGRGLWRIRHYSAA